MTPDPTAGVRRAFYLVVGTLVVAAGLGRLAGAENVFEPSRYKPPAAASYGAGRPAAVTPKRVWPPARPEPSPLFSSNDRSRWMTVVALVEDGTYVIGRRDNYRSQTAYTDAGLVTRDEFKSLDVVMNPATGEFLSSKPPLLPTLAAGGYWVLHRGLGWSLDRDRWWVVGVLLTLVNVLPFALYLAAVAGLIEAYGTTDFGKLLTFTTAAGGTFLTPFLVTFNNHLPAAVCVLFSVYPLVRPRATGGVGEVAVSGLFAGLAAVFELPATAFAVGLLTAVAAARPRRALPAFLPAMLVPVVAHFVCNYQALGQLLPAYGEFGGPWYEYAGSTWRKIKTTTDPTGLGLDYAREPKAVYAFHLLLGHHGFFSLTPVWLAAGGGLVGQAVRARRPSPTRPALTVPTLAAMTLAVSAVVAAFYVWRTTNYGGSCCCARWLMWLTPLWLVGLIPAADRLGRSAAGRVTAAGLLGVSAFSAAYPVSNPWRNPWLMQLGEQAGWFRY